MKTNILVATVTLLVCGFAAAAAPAGAEHAEHHPEGTSAAPAPAGYGQQMKMMMDREATKPPASK